MDLWKWYAVNCSPLHKIIVTNYEILCDTKITLVWFGFCFIYLSLRFSSMSNFLKEETILSNIKSLTTKIKYLKC